MKSVFILEIFAFITAHSIHTQGSSSRALSVSGSPSVEYNGLRTKVDQDSLHFCEGRLLSMDEGC